MDAEKEIRLHRKAIVGLLVLAIVGAGFAIADWQRGVKNGLNGIPGLNGIDGKNGLNGTNGGCVENTTSPGYIIGSCTNGVNGRDGVNGTNGSNGQNGTNGKNGLNGTPGAPGKPAPVVAYPNVTFTFNVSAADARASVTNSTCYNVTGANGTVICKVVLSVAYCATPECTIVGLNESQAPCFMYIPNPDPIGFSMSAGQTQDFYFGFQFWPGTGWYAETVTFDVVG